MDHRIHQVPFQHALNIPTVNRPKQDETKTNFKDILSEQQQTLKISKHASARMSERNIEFDDNLWHSISEKMQEAKQKGITDSLVLTNNAALLVSTTNNTVVTAMNKDEATSRIFTNINGTILIDD